MTVMVRRAPSRSAERAGATRLLLPPRGRQCLRLPGLGRRRPSQVNAIPVELPGKATRMRERWVADFSQLCRQFAEEILQLAAGAPFALYGHSMGAALAYQTAACLQEIHRTPPEAVVISPPGRPPVRRSREYRSSMGLDALREELEAVGGTPPEILADDDIMNLLLTGIQRDYVLHEDFRHASTVLSCPILAFAGAGPHRHPRHAVPVVQVHQRTVRDEGIARRTLLSPGR